MESAVVGGGVLDGAGAGSAVVGGGVLDGTGAGSAARATGVLGPVQRAKTKKGEFYMVLE